MGLIDADKEVYGGEKDKIAIWKRSSLHQSVICRCLIVLDISCSVHKFQPYKCAELGPVSACTLRSQGMNSHRPHRDPHTFLFEVVGGSCTPYMKPRLVDRESIRRVWGPSCRLQASLVWTTAYVAPAGPLTCAGHKAGVVRGALASQRRHII